MSMEVQSKFDINDITQQGRGYGHVFGHGCGGRRRIFGGRGRYSNKWARSVIEMITLTNGKHIEYQK